MSSPWATLGDVAKDAFVATMQVTTSLSIWHRPTYRGRLPRSVERSYGRRWRRRRGRAIRQARRRGERWAMPRTRTA